MRFALVTLGALMVVIPRASLAQTVMRSSDDARIVADVNVFGVADSNSKERTFQSRFLTASEAGSELADYPRPAHASTFLDVGGSFMVRRRLGVGVNYSWTTRDDAVALKATVPHPTFYGAAATGNGATGELSRRETMTSFYLAVIPVRTNRVEWRLLGGPTIFSFKADMVNDVLYTQTAAASSPEQTVAVTGSTTSAVTASDVGFHLGTDFTYFVSRIVGVGAGVRYCDGTVALEREPLSQLSQDVRVGGTQISVGVRLRLAR
jgi:hypothetical protein